MSETCNHDCDHCGQDCGEREAAAPTTEAANPQSHVRKVIGVVSGKGGVGKSMISALLAVTMRRRGFESAILDADITGPSIPKMFGLKQKATGTEEALFPVASKTGIGVMSLNLLLENETDPVIWRGPILAGTVKQFWTDVAWGNVDFMFVDMPPGTGDVVLTVFQSMPVDGLIIVTSPQEMVSMIVAKAVNMARRMQIPILGLVENYSYLACPDCSKRIAVFGESRAAQTAEEYDLPLLAEIPVDPRLAKAGDQGMIELFEGDYLEKAADRLEALLGEGEDEA